MVAGSSITWEHFWVYWCSYNGHWWRNMNKQEKVQDLQQSKIIFSSGYSSFNINRFKDPFTTLICRILKKLVIREIMSVHMMNILNYPWNCLQNEVLQLASMKYKICMTWKSASLGTMMIVFLELFNFNSEVTSTFNK